MDEFIARPVLQRWAHLLYLSLSASSWAKMALFLVFGLGLGIPLLTLSFISDVKGGWLTR